MSPPSTRRRASAGVACLVLLGSTLAALGHVAVKARHLEVALALGTEVTLQRELAEKRRRLRSEIGRLKEPGLISALARDRLGMGPVDPKNIRVLKGPVQVIGRWIKIRMLACAGVLAVLGLLVMRKAVQLQVHDSAQLREFAETNYLKEIEVAPRRGRILDRNGVELAVTVDFDSVFCNPRQLAGTPDAARQLAKALGLESRDVQRIVGQRKYFAWLRRKATREQAAAVLALKLPGVGVRKEPGRVYPQRELAATVLGHTSSDGRGIEGVELAYERALRGSGVQVAGLRDSLGRDLLVDGVVDTSAAAGHDLVLSLDKYLTYVTEKALAQAVSQHKAKAGVAVVMDPRNGEILAMAAVPTYDPGDPRDAVARDAKNRAVTDEFEPGSTMKTFTFAAALDAGALKTHHWFDCQMGRMTIGRRVIRDDHPQGSLIAGDVFKFSSNIGSVKIARRLGKEPFYDALVRFGFGRRTGVGLPGERSGTLHHVRKWGEIEFATHAYGHGMTTTPLQLVTAFAAVASGGVYHPPRLALRTITADGRVEPMPPPPGTRASERIMSEAAARTLLKMMDGVTSKDKGATGKLAAIDGYPVGGKTGTALKVVGGRYDMQKYFASFVGIVPTDNPRLVIGVMIDEPQPIHYGGVVAAPVFKEIGEEALRYLSVPPSLPFVAKTGKDAEKVGKKAPAAVEDELREGLGTELPIAIGEDPADQLVVEGETGVAAPGQELVTIPDFAGMSVGDAIRAARRAGVELAPEGSGVAVTQSPKPGRLPRGSVCRVSFRPGG